MQSEASWKCPAELRVKYLCLLYNFLGHCIRSSDPLTVVWGIQHLYWNPHAHMKVPFIRRECVSLWVFRIGPDTRATCWQLTPTDASQIRGNAEPSLIYDIFLNFTGRQQDTPLGMMGAWKRWKGRRITSEMGRRIFPVGQQPWSVDGSGPGAPNALFPKEKQRRVTTAMLENPLWFNPSPPVHETTP